MGKFPCKVNDKEAVEPSPQQIIKSDGEPSPPQLMKSDPETPSPQFNKSDTEPSPPQGGTDRQVRATEECGKNKECKYEIEQSSPAKGKEKKLSYEDAGNEECYLILPPDSQTNRIDGGQRYAIIEGVERESVDKVMSTFVDEKAEGIMADLQNEPWYHGALPLEDISALVITNGEFLIRELAPYDGRGSMPCLTVRLGSQLKDFPIHTVQIGEHRYFTIDGNHKAKSVIGIVQKHYEEKILLYNDVQLLKPIPKQPWELSKDKIKMSKKLGEGAFGEVWQGTLRQSAVHTVSAAIKVTKLKEDNKRYMQELYKEARLMRQYQHINVVAFFGMVMDNDNVMIVMEMVNGGGLDHYLRKNVVGIPDKCSYSFDVALGLYYLHSKRCMHRDLACRNCLIDMEKNIVKISDFGLSKQADVYKIQPNEKIPTKWQAPEVVATFIYTRECDVYSYGILIWEIFNDAKTPFGEYDNKTVRKRISDPKFRPPLSNDFPNVIRLIIMACWSALPENRPVMKDVAWILRRFQKHNAPNQINGQPTPSTPVANPSGNSSIVQARKGLPSKKMGVVRRETRKSGQS